MQGLKEHASRAQVEARGVEIKEGRPNDGEILAPGLDHLTVSLRPRAEQPPTGAGAEHRRERGVRERRPGAVHPRGGVQRVEDAPAPGVARDNGVPGDRGPARRSVEQPAGGGRRGVRGQRVVLLRCGGRVGVRFGEGSRPWMELATLGGRRPPSREGERRRRDSAEHACEETRSRAPRCTGCGITTWF